MTTNDHLRQHLLQALGYVEYNPTQPPLDQLRKREHSREFMELVWAQFTERMQNRTLMGCLRYGPVGSLEKPDYDVIGSTIRRLQLYQESGNQEYLVDAANMLMLEYLEKHHPRAHWGPLDDAEHAQTR